MRPIFSRTASLVIAAALLLPFGIDQITRSELFPAVIFPSGARPKTSVRDGTATFVMLTLSGFDGAGRAVQLEPGSFIDPITSSNANVLARQLFGQNTSERIDIRIRVLGKTIHVPRHVPSEADRLAARSWLSDKLTEAGLSADRLAINSERFVVDYDTGEVISREVLDQEVIALD